LAKTAIMALLQGVGLAAPEGRLRLNRIGRKRGEGVGEKKFYKV